MPPSFRRIPHRVRAFVLGEEEPDWFSSLVQNGVVRVFTSKKSVIYRINSGPDRFYVGHNGDYLVYDPLSGIRSLSKEEFEKEYERC